MSKFRFSLAAAMAKRRGALERAEIARQRAIEATEQARKDLVDLGARLETMQLRVRDARLGLAEPADHGEAVEPTDACARIDRVFSAMSACRRLREAIAQAQGEVRRREQQQRIAEGDELRCNAAVLALDALAERERCQFLRMRERRDDAQRLDDVLLTWPTPARGEQDEL